MMHPCSPTFQSFSLANAASPTSIWLKVSVSLIKRMALTTMSTWPFIPCPLSLSITCANTAVSITTPCIVGIGCVERMASEAVPLPSVPSRRSFTSENIHSHRNHFKMTRIDAVAHATEVINSQTHGDVFPVQLIGKTMSGNIPALMPEDSVAIRIMSAYPDPAGICDPHLRPKTWKQRQRRTWRIPSTDTFAFHISNYRTSILKVNGRS
ncbi:hypothetical protein LCGC14_0313610 [marine sediment metagenome]|uniref:Uncharacterized protein n=1 Tax=marine sediment metagenome TaxID=412755 RepID=A0A0F9TRX4_9ZZZZ